MQHFNCTRDILLFSVRAIQHRTGNWAFETIIAARKTADCLGGFEYAVKWKEDHKVSWVPQINMQQNATTTKDLELARTTKRCASSLHEWLHQTEPTREVKDGIATIEGRKNRTGWGGVWKLFLRYKTDSSPEQSPAPPHC